METQMLYVHALSPIRVGVGQGAGVIDLPVIREQLTGWPFLPGSSVKGVLRDACTDAGVHKDDVTIVFGPETDNASDHAGGLIFADLRILCLPVRTYNGSFAWITSPLALSRWLRDGLTNEGIPAALQSVADNTIVLPSDTCRRTIQTGNTVRMEDLALTIRMDESAQPLVSNIAKACFNDDFWQAFFMTHVGVVSDTTFSYLAQTATEITARNRIEQDRKVVAEGALWWEEAAPAETIFSGPLIPTRQGMQHMGREGLIDTVRRGTAGPVQIGGNASVGRGLSLVRIPASAQTAEGGQA